MSRWSGEGTLPTPESAEPSAEQRGLSGAVLGLVCCTLFGALFLHLRETGVLVPPQGKTLLDTAANVAEGRGFVVREGVPLGRYPPLYPALLALFARAGLEPITSIYLLGSAVYAATLFGLVALGRAIGVRALGWLFVFLLLRPAMPFFLRAARPDALMLAGAVFALLGAVWYRRGAGTKALVLAAVACAVAAGARYMAMFTLWPVVALALWSAPARAVSRSRHAALFGAIAVLPSVLWLLRTYALTGYVTGMSRIGGRPAAAETTLGGNVVGTLRTAYIDLFGFGEMGARRFVYDSAALSNPYASALFALLFTALWVAIAASWLRRDPSTRFAAPPPAGAGWVGAYVGLYLAALLALWTLGNNDPINTRYVAPVMPFLALLGFAGFESLARSGAPGWQRAALIAAGVLVMVPGAGKTLVMLGEAPPERMMEVKTRRLERWQWQHDFGWDSVPAPQRSRTEVHRQSAWEPGA